MLNRNFLMTTTVIAGLAAAMAVAAPGAAFAQSAPAAAPAPAPAASDDDTEVEVLVVTGSRIKRDEYSSASPIQVITSEQSALEGLVDTAEILQQSSLVAGSQQVNAQFTGFVNVGGVGVSTVSLRGLGAQRTLVLLNGRRLGPAGIGGQVGPVDLNVIPQSMIDRIEILKDGASSIYGSDAIAGVVNFITKSNTDGGNLSIYGNMPYETGGELYRINGSWGKTFDRGYISVGADYYHQEALRRGDREQTACAADYLFDPVTGARKDHLDVDTGKPLCWNILVNTLRTTTLGDLVFTRPGVTYPNSAQGNNSPVVGMARTSRAGYPLTYPYRENTHPNYDKAIIRYPVDRYSLSAFGGFDLTPSTEVYGEFLFNRRETASYSASNFTPVRVTNTLRQTTSGLLFDHVYNRRPDTGLTFGQTITPIIARKIETNQTVDYTHGLVGVRGDFGSFLEGWDWDVYAQWSKSDAEYNTEFMYTDRLAALSTSGSPCTNAPAFGNVSGFDCANINGGAGLNWTDPRVLRGDLNASEQAFLTGWNTGETTYEQKVVEATVTGDLFTLPAGPVGVALGAQWRTEEINDNPGANALAKNMYNYSTGGITKGDDTIVEYFGELEVPLFRGLPGIENLTANLSGRYSDYDSYGTSSTYKIGLNWTITPSWRIRATKGTSFRAPGLYEMHLGDLSGFLSQSSIDPCFDYANSGVSALTQANCLAAGVPNTYNGTFGGGAIPSALIIQRGNNINLKAEESEAKSIGVIWTPDFIDLSVAVDYFEIEVNDEIRRFGAANILSQCYSTTTGASFCSLFERDATTHGVNFVYDAYVNVQSQISRGVDLTIGYNHEFSFGRLALDGQFNWQFQDDTTLLGGGGAVTNNGATLDPDFVGNLSATFDHGDWRVFWGVDFIGKTSDTEGFGGDVFASSVYANLPAGISSNNCAAANNYCSYYKQYTEFTAYHAVSVRRRMDDWTFTAGVNNLFDEAAPSQSTGQPRIGTAAGYNFDLIGRRAFVSIAKTW